MKLSTNAQDTLKAVGHTDADTAEDLELLRNGMSHELLRRMCEQGAEDASTIAGWNEYVDALISELNPS